MIHKCFVFFVDFSYGIENVGWVGHLLINLINTFTLFQVSDVQKWLRRHCSELYSLYGIKFLEQDITGVCQGLSLIFTIHLIVISYKLMFEGRPFCQWRSLPWDRQHLYVTTARSHSLLRFNCVSNLVAGNKKTRNY